jgi:hypothetical protein
MSAQAAEPGNHGPPLDLHRCGREPAYAQRTHPTGKGVRRGDFHLTPTIRSEQSPPRIEIKAWRAGNTVALKHQLLRFRIFHFNHRNEAIELVFLRHNGVHLGDVMKFDPKFLNSALSGLSHCQRPLTHALES